jgi:hypothetical protein
MPNITLSMDEQTLEASRRYAQEHGLSLNALVRRLLQQTVQRSSTSWVDECFAQMDRAAANSGGQRWSRDELHQR